MRFALGSHGLYGRQVSQLQFSMNMIVHPYRDAAFVFYRFAFAGLHTYVRAKRATILRAGYDMLNVVIFSELFEYLPKCSAQLILLCL